MAMIHYQNKHGSIPGLNLSHYAGKARDALRRLLHMYGGVPASVLGGNFAAWQQRRGDLAHRRTEAGEDLVFAPSLYPGGSDTGLGWPYLRYLATAPTAWAGLLFLLQT